MGETFKTKKYDFFNFSQVRISVLVGVRRIDDQDITNKDLKELTQFFNDMGKWENLMKTGISLIEDLGISSIGETVKERTIKRSLELKNTLSYLRK